MKWEAAQSFTEYLAAKKIYADGFAAQDAGRYAEYESAFDVLGAVNFDQRYKFIINNLRLAYPIPVMNDNGAEQ